MAVLTLIVLLRKKVNLGIVMILESIYLVILARLTLNEYLSAVFVSIRSYSTLKLIFVFIFIMILENILRKSGMIKDIVDSLKEIIGNNRIVTGVLPIVVGLLPSPGGARFSCPMVEEIAGERSSTENLTFVNYWFRHIWMDGFFLYPGAILAAELLGIHVIDFFLRLLPFMIFTAVIGYFVGLKKIEKENIVRTRKKKENIMIFIRSIFPVILIIVIYMLLVNITPYSLELAMVIGTVYTLVSKKYNFKRIIDTLKESFPYKLIFIIVGVMIFKETLFKTELLDGLPGFLNDSGIPIYIAFLILPFIIGMFTGIAVSLVSITFPILLTLGLADNTWYSVLAYCAGYIGLMVTPIHLCMVVSSEYFRHSISKVMKKVIFSEIPLLIIVTVAMILLF